VEGSEKHVEEMGKEAVTLNSDHLCVVHKTRRGAVKKSFSLWVQTMCE
jgi:hypothetical protein